MNIASYKCLTIDQIEDVVKVLHRIVPTLKVSYDLGKAAVRVEFPDKSYFWMMGTHFVPASVHDEVDLVIHIDMRDRNEVDFVHTLLASDRFFQSLIKNHTVWSFMEPGFIEECDNEYYCFTFRVHTLHFEVCYDGPHNWKDEINHDSKDFDEDIKKVFENVKQHMMSL